MSACLDSWAVIAWLEGREPALSRLNDLIDAGAVMSWINAVDLPCAVEDLRAHPA